MTASTDSNAGINLDVYELIWFKPGMMIDTSVLYILIIVHVTLTQGQRSVRKQKLLHQLSHKVCNRFG